MQRKATKRCSDRTVCARVGTDLETALCSHLLLHVLHSGAYIVFQREHELLSPDLLTCCTGTSAR